jgi:hypothetical protein
MCQVLLHWCICPNWLSCTSSTWLSSLAAVPPAPQPKEWLAQGPHRPAGTFGPHSPAELPPASHTSLLVARLQHALAAGAAAASANEGAGCADGCEADSAALGFSLARVAQHAEDDDKPGPGTYDLDMALSLSANVARAVAAGSSAGFKSSVLTDGLSR